MPRMVEKTPNLVSGPSPSGRRQTLLCCGCWGCGAARQAPGSRIRAVALPSSPAAQIQALHFPQQQRDGRHQNSFSAS